MFTSLCINIKELATPCINVHHSPLLDKESQGAGAGITYDDKIGLISDELALDNWAMHSVRVDFIGQLAAGMKFTVTQRTRDSPHPWLISSRRLHGRPISGDQ